MDQSISPLLICFLWGGRGSTGVFFRLFVALIEEEGSFRMLWLADRADFEPPEGI